MKLLCEFFVSGHPMPAGSKKFVGINPKTKRALIVDQSGSKGTKWRELCQQAADRNYKGELTDKPLLVELTFLLSRPKLHIGRGGKIKPLSPRHHTVKPDCLKLARAVEDALKNHIYVDDSQIVKEIIQKKYINSQSTEEGCIVVVREYEKLRYGETIIQQDLL